MSDRIILVLAAEEDTVEALLEPLLRLLALDAVREADARRAVLAASDAGSGAAHDDVHLIEEDCEKWVSYCLGRGGAKASGQARVLAEDRSGVAPSARRNVGADGVAEA